MPNRHRLQIHLLTGLALLTMATLPAEESLLFDGLWEYHRDHGEAFGSRADGLRYGWTEPREAGNAQNVGAPSEKYDTHVAMPAGAQWEIEVPDGTYRVLVVAGDPVDQQAHLHVLVEGQVAIDQRVSGAKFWHSGHIEVTVEDGRLTLTGGESARNTHLLYLQVYSPMYGHYPEPTLAELPLRINCGGPAVDGFRADQKWTENADFGFIPIDEDGEHRWRHDTPEQAVYGAWRTVDFRSVPAEVEDIPGTELDAVHRTMICQLGSKKDKPGPGFRYQVRLPKGTYALTVLVTNMSDKRPSWTDCDLHVEDKVVPIRPGELTSRLYEAASVRIEGIVVDDGIMDITPYFVGWHYSWGATISGLIIEAADGQADDAVGGG
ncbi:MAG: hypothetical protein ACOCVS_02045 [Planctomycetota bacterium]